MKPRGPSGAAKRRRRRTETSAQERDHLMEQVVERGNVEAALKRVKQNKGSPGVDGMTVDELPAYLAAHWDTIREQLLAGRYQPQPVKRQAIPKTGGGVRELGIPTRARPVHPAGHPAGAAAAIRSDVLRAQLRLPTGAQRARRRVRAQRYIQEGRRWVVDVDLAKFFDRVNHDVLMGRLAKTDRGPSAAGAHPPLPRRRHHGGRGGGGAARGDAARRPPLAAAWRTCSSTKWTRSWRSAGTPSRATPTTATCTCGRSERANDVMADASAPLREAPATQSTSRRARWRDRGTANSSATASG